MAKRRKVSKKKVRTFIFVLIVMIIAIIGAIFYVDNNEKEKPITIKSVDKIEGYDYTLSSNATKYYKSLFKQLKEVLEDKEVDESKYADLVTKLFIADFYNLDNKTNKNDIGGVMFVYKDFREDFKKIAADSIYKNVLNNTYGDRKESLPVVTNVSTEKKDNSTFKYGDSSDDKAYNINFKITYKNEEDYQDSGKIILIHNDKKLEIAALEESSEN